MSKTVNLIGATDNRLAPFISKLTNDNRQVTAVVPTVNRAVRLASDLSFFTCTPVYIMPEFELSDFSYDAKSLAQEAKRIAALAALSKGEKCIVIVPVLGALPRFCSSDKFKRNTIRLSFNETIERADLIQKLVIMGYERVDFCEAPGQFAVRGDIFDIFPMGNEFPVRAEFFDIELDSLRSYDPNTQRSIENIDTAEIFPAQMDEGISYVWEYCCGPVVVDDPTRMSEVLKAVDQSIEFPVKNNDLYIATPFSQGLVFAEKADEIVSLEAKQAPMYAGHMEMLEKDLRSYVSRGYSVTIACQNTERLVNLRDFLSASALDGKIILKEGSLVSGTEYPKTKELYLSEAEIFPYMKRKSRRKHDKSREIKVFTDIKQGDYVVHEAHGVGQFVGVEKKTILGSTKDYLRINYAAGDVLYVPVDQMVSIQKYVGSESIAPKIYRLSGSDWNKTKERVKAAIKDMAEEFLRSAANRQAAPGFAFGPDSSWQKEFEDSFPYEETDDQLRCVEEIKKDMESDKAMDRLLCGDVGYGKTEVAARAIFKCLEQGKQAAVLVPTTILANQHYHTFLDRFKNYPFKIETLSRFRTASQQEQIIDSLRKGDIDLVVGTHRMLSNDVAFKDLGLLVVDEEQRFGVEHKERIKQLKTNVDVLTLSATPIPRTLHMSLTGIRNMSVIEQPPEDRYPVQTYVLEQDDLVIADAIKRELARGGQVYVVYNKVHGIETVARKLRTLIPDAVVAVGHGQMNERQLEDVMLDFVEGRSQILLATTIIESGLDIPNVNTMIILDADRLGLAQLYQLRGRVGRSDRLAYAYLVYKKDKSLSEAAEKRLKAIKEFTEFGSGFRVAMRDLEIRGAGNILGVEQSGHMVSVGYELYCKLVDEAVREIKGETADIPLSADTAVELSLSAFLPESYIADEITRLDMYKRISSVSDLDARSEVEDELIDRFGDLPKEAVNLLDISLIHNIASRLGVERIVLQQNKLIFAFEENNKLSPNAIAQLMDSYDLRLTIYGGVNPRISLVLKGVKASEEALAMLQMMES